MGLVRKRKIAEFHPIQKKGEGWEYWDRLIETFNATFQALDFNGDALLVMQGTPPSEPGVVNQVLCTTTGDLPAIERAAVLSMLVGWVAKNVGPRVWYLAQSDADGVIAYDRKFLEDLYRRKRKGGSTEVVVHAAWMGEQGAVCCDDLSGLGLKTSFNAEEVTCLKCLRRLVVLERIRTSEEKEVDREPGEED